MTYQIFQEKIIAYIKENISENEKVFIQSVPKNNGIKLDGLVIIQDEMNIAPTIYLNYYYQKYQEGMDFSEICREILENYKTNKPSIPIDIHFFTDFEKIKSRIVYRLINFRQNLELLDDVPYVRFLDLALVFYCLLPAYEEQNASIQIRMSHLDLWKTSLRELIRLSEQNTPRLLEWEIQDMASVVEENAHLPSEDCYPMLILSNKSHLNGAGCILYKDLLKNLSRKLDMDFFILPSSVHEVILLPTKTKDAMGELSAMVKEINAAEIAREDILSDHAYYYSGKEDRIIM